MTINSVSQDIFTAGFSASGAGIIDQNFLPPFVSGGMTFSQANGALSVASGVNANAEFLARSQIAFSGAMRKRFTFTASQRIAGNNFAVLLADLLGENVAYTAVSATQVNVTIPGHKLNAENVGQFVLLGALLGPGGVPGRYPIAAIPDENTISFTVAGWTVGSGTLTAFGRNYVRSLFTGTTVTQFALDAQRNGWATGDTTANIQTTNAPGLLVQTDLSGRKIVWSDSLRASSSTPTLFTRGSRFENIPDDNVGMYVFLWSFNGTAAPASTTTFSLGHVCVETFGNNPVYLQGSRMAAGDEPLPVQGSIGVSAGTNAMGDIGVQYRANATGAATPANVNSPATPVAQAIKAAAGRLLPSVLTNHGASTVFVKFFNVASGSVTMGTTSALFEVALAPNQSVPLFGEGGVGFSTAISIAITGARGLQDATAIAANSVTGFIAFA